MKNKKEILEKLKDDEHYYGEYGRQFISNSDIRTLMTNPLEFKKPTPSAPHFLIGGYFPVSYTHLTLPTILLV